METDTAPGNLRIIGWDAAVDPRNTALALAEFTLQEPHGGLSLLDLVSPRDRGELVETVADWCGTQSRVILCVDAPLGWPQMMGPALSDHDAGENLALDPDQLFRRATDIDIRRRLGKTPLDVGADRIARTALAALQAIASVGEHLAGRRRIVPAILPGDIFADPPTIPLLETYPAGWFASEGIATRGYRPRDARERRGEVYALARRAFEDGLGEPLRSRVPDTQVVYRADDLDAVICTFIGVDAIRGLCPGPGDAVVRQAATEGWIWCKDPRRKG